ncbi:MAG: methionine adenosyltransferase [Candidatus Brocadiia bacterium]
MRKYFFTSESVAMGHPDKVSDQISDAVLDAILAQDRLGRVAVETLVTSGLVMVAGEVTTNCYVDVPAIAREVVRDVGYVDATWGFNFETCGVITSIHGQSPDISQGVTEGEGLHPEAQGAGDQGIMFGFACDETPEFMPLPIHLSHRLMENCAMLRQTRKIPWLRPDGKSEVTVEYHDRKPVRVHAVVCSVQHDPDVSHDEIEREIINKLIKPTIPRKYLDSRTTYHINPTGRFVLGGPMADTGLTGRKIIVDTYGGRGRHGGGAFSGKDPSKVDRSASYAARHCAKNIVAAGLAGECEIEVAYAIGVAEPLALYVDTRGTGKLPDTKLEKIVAGLFDFRPKPMIQRLDLLRPIYKETARFGHFGRNLPNFTWERLDMVEALKQAAKV